MSRYREDPRYSGGDLPYRDAPPQRWDTDRFARERDYRGPPVVERDPYAADPYRSPPRRAPAVVERDRYYEDDRYGPRGDLRERKVYQEEDYYRDPRATGGAMVPFRPERPSRPEPVPRPGILRRQSSLDTFDRRPNRRYDESHDNYRPGPPARAPGRYDDVRIQDPDQYGDDGFREYREREWITKRRRSGSRSRSHSRDRASAVESVREEKPYPRRGKTRMPRRLVHTKVLYDLGYPFYEEDERTILIEKALGPENIDQVFTLSKEYRERETSTTRLLEAPPEIIREEKILQEIKTVPMSEAPRSVREWDHLSVRSPSPRSHKSRSRSRRRSRRGSSPSREVKEVIIEKERIVREVSPARTNRTSRSHHHHDHHDHHDHYDGSSHSGSEVIIEKTKIITQENDFDESNSVHVGPLALVVDRKPSRTDRDIKDEIRRLERERREIRRERRTERDGIGGEIVRVERVRDRSLSPKGEVIVERRGEEILEVKKDRRVRSRSAAPSPAIIKAMFATLT